MSGPIANSDMAAAWDGPEGQGWAANWQTYDHTIEGYSKALLTVADIKTHDRVLDIGCGNGLTSREAARTASEGSVLGVDLSSPMLTRAREQAATEGLNNLSFLQADAQVHAFEPESFDLAISRFGSMFFADPVAAFANIRKALRPSAQLHLVVWRGIADNEWMQASAQAVWTGREMPRPSPSAPGPLGLADPDHTRSVLTDAGFASVLIEPIDAPFHISDDVETAFDFVSSTGMVRGATQDLTPDQKAVAMGALHDTIAAHHGPDGVTFRSGCWLICAS